MMKVRSIFFSIQLILQIVVVVDRVIVVDKLVAYTVENVALVVDELIRLAKYKKTKRNS
jgi:hypothetical protein